MSTQPDGTTAPSLSAASFADVVLSTVASVSSSQAGAVSQAALAIAESVRDGGVVQAFGTGHSEAFAMEIAGRAGGLIPTNKLALRDAVAVAAASDDVDASVGGQLERDPVLGPFIYDLAPDPRPEDVFLIASNSGGNGSIVEFARLVRERGHRLIAVTSMQHTSTITSRHPSGQRLFEVADIVLDNGAPYGDAVLPLPGGGTACGISSITAALLAQQMVAEAIARLMEWGVEPPVYLSANIPGGDEHNDALEARYAGRLRRGL